MHLVLTLGSRELDRKLAKQLQLQLQGVALQSVNDFGGDTDEVLMGYGHMGKTETQVATDLLADACAVIGVRR